MSAELVIAVDCSTTACKALAFDPAGTALAEARAPIALDNPLPDAWQQDAEAWWDAFCCSLRQLCAGLGRAAGRVAALGLTHQRETFVLTDAGGRPLHPALVWMDSRCRPQVAAAIEKLGAERLHQLSGKPPCTTPSLYKLMFLLAERPELGALRPRVLDVHAFLAWRLTGRCATSLASADPLGLVDMRQRCWAEELCALGGIEPSQLPELVAPGSALGAVSVAAAAQTGLRPGLPVIAGAGDGQCAGLGAGIRRPGRAYLNLGTAIVSGVLAGEYRCDAAFRTLYGAAPGTFFLETDLKGGTFTVDWLVEHWLPPGLTKAAAIAQLEPEAAGLPAGAGGLLLVPYWNGVMNPYWDDDARGLTVGWTGAHRPAHLYRAILEGIAFEQRLHTTGVERAAGPISELIVMGGGSRSDLWCQILADVLQKPIVRAGTGEATALGAAVLAATAGGLHPDLETATAAMTRTGARFEPGPRQAIYDRLYREVYRHLYPGLQPQLARLAELSRAATPERSEADIAGSAT